MSRFGSSNGRPRYCLIEGYEAAPMFHGKGKEVDVSQLAGTEESLVVETGSVAEGNRVCPERMVRNGNRA